ncbi:aldehyde dehydrogenase family protein [bacterium]|nr:aldehyde dehydrogenase family protein [bacterium]RQV98686.1 MAG: aldehyde dehydrogenase family protein [bacterium]
MKKDFPFFISGEEQTSDEQLEVRNPFNNEIIGITYRPTAKDVEKAIASSIRAFEKTKYLPSYARSNILQIAAEEIEKRKDELAKILCLESGKPIRHALGEVTRAVSTLTIASEEAKHIEGEVLSMDITPAAGDRLGIVRRFPIGPIVGISPFNFPLNLVCHKVAPALASGNTITIKPASATPLSALCLGEILHKAGAIPGSINVLPCSAKSTEPLVYDPRLKMITFTGSADVGWHIKSRAGKKRVCLELGGNAAVVVEPDADMKYAVERSILGGFAYAGQICISVQRIFIHEKIYDSFRSDLISGVEKLILGDPLSEKTDVGPMIDESALIKTEEWIKEAINKGAELLTGGKRKDTLFEPTVLENVNRKAKVACEEVFAPVVVLDKYKTVDEAINLVNNSKFGLQAGIFTHDIEKAFYAFNHIDVGGVIINDIPTYRVDHMPYGGVKNSGFGREGVKYAIEEMTELKIMVVNHGLT